MRFILYILFTFILLFSHAAPYSIFEKGGLFGLKDPKGEVAIPAIYKKLGWSDGSTDIVSGVMGFMQNDLWGLISIKNKKLTDTKFYSLKPINENLISASVRGKFSNQLFYGVIDSKAGTRVSFNFFELTPINDLLLISVYDGGRHPKGLISFENEVIVPVSYLSIDFMGSYVVATGFDRKKTIFKQSGFLVTGELDSVRILKKGFLCYKNGLAGYYDSNGNLVNDFQFKGFEFADDIPIPIPFPTWEVHTTDGKQFQWECDSLQFRSGIWVAYLNGAQHIVLTSSELLDSREYELKNVTNRRLVVKHSKSQKWSVLNQRGEALVADYDSIQYNDEFIFGQKEATWDIFNSFGTRISQFSYQQIFPGFENYIIAKKNDYWGVVDFKGAEYITFKYDSIRPAATGFYAVNYLDKWGIMDKHGNWLAYPDFAEITHFGELILARTGQVFSIFYDGHFRFRTAFNTSHREGDFLIIEDKFENKGIIGPTGIMIASPRYKAINAMGDYFELEAGDHSVLTDYEGKRLVTESHGIEDIKGVSEGYILSRKNNRWGFLDMQARLRISNRYDDSQPFSDGMAAIKLRGKVGIY